MTELPAGELSSWKEIAAYLGVGLRTAQLWEQERSLPVHRLPGGRGRVFARTAELDAWKHSGGLQTADASCAAIPDVSVADPPLAIPIDSGHLWTRCLWSLGGALLLVLALLTANRLPGKPFSCRIEHNTLIVLDSRGRECWRKAFPYALMEGNSPELASLYTWIGDLDGDGRNELLFAPHPFTAGQESTPLICYDSRGVERWRFANRRHVRSRAQEFAPVFGLARFLVTSRGKGLSNVVLVATTHELYYPSQVVLLAPDGRIVHEYWHSGHLNHLQAADLDGNGRTEFVLAGINNARHAATLVVLDEDHFAGASQEPENPDHQLLDFPTGSERNRIIFPRSCLNTTFDPYNPVATLSVNYGEIVLQTMELIGPGAGIFHHLSYDFRQHRVVISDSYRVEYQRAKSAGQLSASCTPDSLPDLRTLRSPALD